MKIRLVLPVAMAAMLTPAQADTRDDIKAAIERCGVMNDNRVWLDCVYGAIQPMRAQLGLQPAPEFQQRLVPPAQTASVAPPPPPARTTTRAAPRKSHGFFDNLLNAPPVAVSKMASYRYEKSGAFVVALANGQQWRQADTTGGTISWTKPASSYTVTITRGAFGDYALRVSDSPQTYRVQPVK